MAKLPRYDRQVLRTELAPAAGTQNLQAETQYSKTLQGALDQLTKITGIEAEKYAGEVAEENFLDTPLTLQDYQKAARTGEDPVQRLRTGGTTYNETLTKLYANQAKADLLNQLQLDQESVLTRVKSGELADIDSIKGEMSAAVSGYSNVISNIDAEAGMQFSSQAATYTKQYFKSAMKEVSEKAEAELQLKVQSQIEGFARNLENFIQEESDPYLINAHINLLEENARSSFKSTGKVTENMKAFRKKMKAIQLDAIGLKIANEANMAGKTEEEVIRNLTSANTPFAESVYGPYFSDLLSDEKVDLIAKVKTAMNNLDAKKDISNAFTNNLITRSNKMVDNGEIPDLTKLTKLQPTFNEKQNLDFLIMQQKLVTNNLFNDMDTNSMDQYINGLTKLYPADQKRSVVESAVINHAMKLKDKIKKDAIKNPVEFASNNSRYSDDMMPIKIDFNRMADPKYSEDVEQAFLQRKTVMNKFANDFGLQEVNFFSQSEVDYYYDKLENATANEMILITTGLVQAFPGAEYELFSQINKKSTSLAHIGNLVGQAYSSPEGMESNNAKLLAEGIVIERGIDGISASYELPSTQMRDKADDILANAFPPTEKAIVIDAATKIYKALNKSKPGTYNDNIFAEALELSAGKFNDYGGLVEYNNRMVAVPANIKTKEFDNIFNKASIDDIKQVAVDGMGDVIGNVLGPNQIEYDLKQFQKAQIVFINATTAKFMYDDKVFTGEDGTPIKINISDLYNIVSEKNPGSFNPLIYSGRK